MNKLDKLMIEKGLVNVEKLDPTILFDIRYATSNNFTGRVLYKEPFGVFVHPSLAESLAKVNSNLKRQNPDLRLVIFDAARPLSIQKEMFEIVKGTPSEPYIANPYGEFAGGFHNYGLAVDLSIKNIRENALLDMGTDYDSFSTLSNTGNEELYFKEGRLSWEAFENRIFLFRLLEEERLFPHPKEWWHFQKDYREEAKNPKFILDF